MVEIVTILSFAKLGWILVQFLWISTLLIAVTALVLKLLDRFSSRLKYGIAVGILFLMTIIPGLLWIEHNGTLPPIGLADWGSETEVVDNSIEPVIEGLPKVGSIDLGEQSYSIYFWLGVMWTVGAFLYLSYSVISALLLHYKCRKLEFLQDSQIRRQIEELAAKLNISPNFHLKKTSLQQGPAVAGIRRSYILIPSSLSDDYDKEELKALLLHELIHIKRKDYLFSLLQCIIGSIFFIQPLVGWFNRRIDQEREQACDEAVTAITNDSYTYATTLVKLYQQTQPALGHVLNITEKSIVSRIRRLTQRRFDTKNMSQKCVRSLLAGLILVITLFVTVWNSYHLHYFVIQ